MSRLQNMNPFGSGGYIRLPTSEPPSQLPAPNAEQENAAWFTLSRWDRILVFAACLLGAVVCFFFAFLLLPVLALKPRKFAVLWTVGSTLFLASFAFLQGALAYLQHLLSGPRLPFTAFYFTTIGLTLYFSVGLQSTVLTILASVAQLIALIWYLISYFPMGSQGLRFASRIGARRAVSWING